MNPPGRKNPAYGEKYANSFPYPPHYGAYFPKGPPAERMPKNSKPNSRNMKKPFLNARNRNNKRNPGNRAPVNPKRHSAAIVEHLQIPNLILLSGYPGTKHNLLGFIDNFPTCAVLRCGLKGYELSLILNSCDKTKKDRAQFGKVEISIPKSSLAFFSIEDIPEHEIQLQVTDFDETYTDYEKQIIQERRIVSGTNDPGKSDGST